MTDYSKNQDYAAKDALVTGDPDKLILGSDLGGEFDELVTAVATKYDDTDIASQAQAEAGVSNTTLITPLRLFQALSGAGGGTGAGMVGDIITLTDPNADRGLFWDDSAGAVALFSLGTGLTFTNTELDLVLAQIDHDQLLNFVANEHIDHSAVSITAGTGLTGGGTIAASRTLSLDINGLTTDASPDPAADYVPTYDASAGTSKKVLMSNIGGTPLGDGNWYRSTSQTIPAAVSTTIIYDTAVYDQLQRGTYSTSTGIYTAGSSGARLAYTATFCVAALGASRSMTLIASATGTEVIRATRVTVAAETFVCITVSGVVSLGASGTFSVAGFVTTTANSTIASTSGIYNTLSITELG